MGAFRFACAAILAASFAISAHGGPVVDVSSTFGAYNQPDLWGQRERTGGTYRRFLFDSELTASSYYTPPPATPTPEPASSEETCETRFVWKVRVKAGHRLDMDLVGHTIVRLVKENVPGLAEAPFSVITYRVIDSRNKLPDNTCDGRYAKKFYTDLKFKVTTMDPVAAEGLERYLDDVDLAEILMQEGADSSEDSSADSSEDSSGYSHGDSGWDSSERAQARVCGAEEMPLYSATVCMSESETSSSSQPTPQSSSEWMPPDMSDYTEIGDSSGFESSISTKPYYTPTPVPYDDDGDSTASYRSDDDDDDDGGSTASYSSDDDDDDDGGSTASYSSDDDDDEAMYDSDDGWTYHRAASHYTFRLGMRG